MGVAGGSGGWAAFGGPCWLRDPVQCLCVPCTPCRPGGALLGSPPFPALPLLRCLLPAPPGGGPRGLPLPKPWEQSPARSAQTSPDPSSAVLGQGDTSLSWLLVQTPKPLLRGPLRGRPAPHGAVPPPRACPVPIWCWGPCAAVPAVGVPLTPFSRCRLSSETGGMGSS